MPCKVLTTNMSAFYIRDVTNISSKCNKYARNQTGRDLFWLFFFYFPMKVVKDHVHNSWGAIVHNSWGWGIARGGHINLVHSILRQTIN